MPDDPAPRLHLAADLDEATRVADTKAAELGVPVQRVDLSAVVGASAAETEKNLAALFDAAERSGAVLLFDEADALFGQRTEVKDSHDRYANAEVSFLLRRLEDHAGPAVLARRPPD
jgi:SpoVK/Ycf46/Vps4 family AAA+-type ATPase